MTEERSPRQISLRAAAPISLLQVAAALWFFWRDHLRLPGLLLVLAFVVLTAALIAPTTFLRVRDLTLRLGQLIGRLLGLVLSLTLGVVLVLPVTAWQRATGGGSVRGRNRLAAWRSVGSSLPDRPGSQEPETARHSLVSASRFLGVSLLCLVTLWAVTPSALNFAREWRTEADGTQRPDPVPPSEVDRADLSPPFVNSSGQAIDASGNVLKIVGFPVDDLAHEGEPFAPLLFRETVASRAVEDPVLGSRLLDFAGKYVNVSDGRRHSYTQPGERTVVWFFGGSTMFGIGQRDEHTIPSQLARLAEMDGTLLEVVNFGVSGDTNWVATERFEQAITSELERPDLAVFYDGTNEAAVAGFLEEIGAPITGEIDRAMLSDEERERRRDRVTDPVQVTAEEVDARAGEQYARGVALARAHGAWFDVPVVHFWQPQATSRKATPADEALYSRLGTNTAFLPRARQRYAKILESADVDVIDISDAMDVSDAPVYFDWSHHNELGARLVADAMYSHLRSRLAE